MQVPERLRPAFLAQHLHSALSVPVLRPAAATAHVRLNLDPGEGRQTELRALSPQTHVTVHTQRHKKQPTHTKHFRQQSSGCVFFRDSPRHHPIPAVPVNSNVTPSYAYVA